MNWSAWAPSLISVATAIFIAGMMYSKQKDHDEQLLSHDKRFERIEAKDSLQDVALAKLEAWRDGYNAASQRNSD